MLIEKYIWQRNALHCLLLHLRERAKCIWRPLQLSNANYLESKQLEILFQPFSFSHTSVKFSKVHTSGLVLTRSIWWWITFCLSLACILIFTLIFDSLGNPLKLGTFTFRFTFTFPPYFWSRLPTFPSWSFCFRGQPSPPNFQSWIQFCPAANSSNIGRNREGANHRFKQNFLNCCKNKHDSHLSG